MSLLLLYGIFVAIFSLVGGFLVLWKSELAKKFMTPLLAFAAGVLLGVSFLEILPEALHDAHDEHVVFILFLVGFFIFFALERLLMKYFLSHSEEEELKHREHTETLPLLLMSGDAFHNFVDGAILALAFVVNPGLGFVTALALIMHEIPRKLGDFAILLDQGWSKLKVVVINALSSLLTVVGVVIGYLTIGFFEGSMPYLLAIAAGLFTYIAASDIIPEIHHRAEHNHAYRILAAFLVGLVVIWIFIEIMHH